jgi:hypothetical protein
MNEDNKFDKQITHDKDDNYKWKFEDYFGHIVGYGITGAILVYALNSGAYGYLKDFFKTLFS